MYIPIQAYQLQECALLIRYTLHKKGSSTCPNMTGTELVYSGRAGGSFFENSCGGANYLCLPEDPDYTLQFAAGVQGHAHVHGVEYESPIAGMHDYDVPCAVCHVTTRDTVPMIPAKIDCPSSWTKEYHGYLMTDSSIHHRTMFVCVDSDQEKIPDSEADTNGALFYHVEGIAALVYPALRMTQSRS